MKALDSRTISGKRIDMIINQLSEGVEAVKTNFYGSNYEIEAGHGNDEYYTNLWQRVYQPLETDVIFLLGGKVSKRFLLKHNGVVLYAHPSKVMSKIEVAEYVRNAVEIVKNNVKELA